MEKINYHRSDHRSFFSNVFELFRNEFSSDCKIISQEGFCIDVHRIMMIKAPFLTKLINSVCCCHGSCAHQEEITLMLPDIEYVHLEPVIDYLYTGVLSVAESERRPVSEILSLFQVNINEASLSDPPNKEIECPECSDNISPQDILDHLIESHIKAPCLLDMKSVLTSNNTAIKCSQHKYQNPNQSCDIDANIQVISNGYFNYAGKKDPLDIVLMHYKVHFDNVLAWVIQNTQMNSKTNFGDLFQADIWKESILEETGDDSKDAIMDSQENDNTNKNSDDAMENNDVDNTNDTCENYPNDVINDSIEESDSNSHSGGMSENEEKRKKSAIKSSKKFSKTRGSKLSLNKNKRKPDKNHSVRKTRCMECNAETDSSTFRKHLVTHFYHLWSDAETKFDKCQYRTCTYVNTNTKFFIQHLAIIHEELDEKLKQQNKTIADYEIIDGGNGPCSGIEGESGGIQTLLNLPRKYCEENGFLVHDTPDQSSNENTREATEEKMVVDDDHENTISDDSIATEPLEIDENERMNDFE